MKKLLIAVVSVAMIGAFSNAHAAPKATIHLGGGFNSNMAPASTQTSGGIFGSVDFNVPERPFAIGVFGEGYFKKAAGKPVLLGLDLYYKKIVGERNVSVYGGPNIGLAYIQPGGGGKHESVFHLGVGAGVDVPVKNKLGVFATAKYAWAAKKNGVKTMNGISVLAGISFNVGE